MSTATLMTVEQFAQMKTADTEDHELAKGELAPFPSGTPQHARVRDRLAAMLWIYFSQHPLGQYFAETDCQISADIVRRPDISVFLGDRVEAIRSGPNSCALCSRYRSRSSVSL